MQKSFFIYFLKSIYRFKTKFVVIALTILFAFAFIADLGINNLEGRPGGGRGFRSGRKWSGGGSSSGGGGGGYYSGGRYIVGGGGISPTFALLILIAIVVIFFIYSRAKPNQDNVIVSSPEYDDYISRKNYINGTIENWLKKVDPNFSTTLFLDFAQLIITQLQARRNKPEFNHLHPYVNSIIIEAFKQKDKNIEQVSEIVIGGIEIIEVREIYGQTMIITEVDYNYTENYKINAKSQRVIKLDRFTWLRNSGLISPQPDKLSALSCPGCGSTLETNSKDECTHCGNIIHPGEKQWYLSDLKNLNTEVTNGDIIGANEEEVGTNLPTVFDPNLDLAVNAFLRRHSINSMDSYWNDFSNNVIYQAFYTLNDSWTSLKWEKARPIITDYLFQTQQYYIELYKRKRVFPHLKNINLINAELVKIDLDKFYDTITIRLFASCYDYMEDANGKIISGSNRKLRKYSEYWTFIRSANIHKDPGNFRAQNCPSCGAQADNMGQSGVCEYCGSKITAGNFDWVLSRITQDEAYFG